MSEIKLSMSKLMSLLREMSAYCHHTQDVEEIIETIRREKIGIMEYDGEWHLTDESGDGE
jgi:stress response protein YsnF